MGSIVSQHEMCRKCHNRAVYEDYKWRTGEWWHCCLACGHTEEFNGMVTFTDENGVLQYAQDENGNRIADFIEIGPHGTAQIKSETGSSMITFERALSDQDIAKFREEVRANGHVLVYLGIFRDTLYVLEGQLSDVAMTDEQIALEEAEHQQWLVRNPFSEPGGMTRHPTLEAAMLSIDKHNDGESLTTTIHDARDGSIHEISLDARRTPWRAMLNGEERNFHTLSEVTDAISAAQATDVLVTDMRDGSQSTRSANDHEDIPF